MTGVGPTDASRALLPPQAGIRTQSHTVEGAAIRPIPRSKRALDLVVAFTLLALAAPLFPLIALIVRRDGGPVFFRQRRIGAGGEPFEILKFRSMVVGAEERLHSDPELFRAFVANGYKLDPKDDPRLTREGHFLRRTSLDELPQLLSVLKGDMSMVGPRPILMSEEAAYAERGVLHIYASTKPGITGAWQTSGRCAITYDERLALTIDYIGNRSLRTDLKILAKTVTVVLRRTGAH